MKPSRYRIEENAAYKLSRHEFNYDRHRQQHEHYHGTDENRRASEKAFRVAHLVQLAGILTPVAVTHFIKEPENQWRAVRLASIITAVLTGGIWEAHHHNKQKREKEHGHWVDQLCDELGKDGQGHTPGM